MADPRMQALDGFTSTTHHSVPSSLEPSKVALPDQCTVCILGAGTGIGEHIAYSFAEAHATAIVIAARTLSDLRDVEAEIHRLNPDCNVFVKECDVSQSSSVEALASFVGEECGRLDVLILNAGYAGPVILKMHEGDPSWVQKAFEVNTLGTYYAAHYFVPLLLHSPNGLKAFWVIGSFAGCLRRGPIANTGYCVSKMAQIRLVEYLHEQYATDGLASIVIHPGAVLTRMAKGNTPEEFMPCKLRKHYEIRDTDRLLIVMVDKVDLCGAVCVYLCQHRTRVTWLSGRLISANWDMEQLMQNKDEVVEKNLLKFAMLTE
jgi:NAD(P)-dependent dehydrogenase (short-subunit alcohol dehydrogenase family)